SIYSHIMRFPGRGATLPTILSLAATIGLFLVNISVPITHIDITLLRINGISAKQTVLSGLWGACNADYTVCSNPKLGYQINHLNSTILGYLAVTHILAAVLSFILTCIGGCAHKLSVNKPLLRSAARLAICVILVDLLALLVDYLVYKELISSNVKQVELGNGWWIIIGRNTNTDTRILPESLMVGDPNRRYQQTLSQLGNTNNDTKILPDSLMVGDPNYRRPLPTPPNRSSYSISNNYPRRPLMTPPILSNQHSTTPLQSPHNIDNNGDYSYQPSSSYQQQIITPTYSTHSYRPPSRQNSQPSYQYQDTRDSIRGSVQYNPQDQRGSGGDVRK
ncbi:13791_t:CDS:2, partial [Ambispora leptoticha]